MNKELLLKLRGGSAAAGSTSQAGAAAAAAGAPKPHHHFRLRPASEAPSRRQPGGCTGGAACRWRPAGGAGSQCSGPRAPCRRGRPGQQGAWGGSYRRSQQRGAAAAAGCSRPRQHVPPKQTQPAAACGSDGERQLVCALPALARCSACCLHKPRVGLPAGQP